ncbi:Transcriptional activator hac1 [Hyphodiscus hymeniophilus]|uniref:Transcriptional activator hac1 n=1 Tax=Hyphodiscus hymeniophilus TaxID=353542 RepID=A0A9P6VLA6_9HELO|nr:Transcriptional activator hac1 [Hyphodiscus hymeniophilus]
MSQNIKFENSPADSIADSFVSTPGTQYPSLFDSMDPDEAMTPQSYNEDSMFGDDMDGSMNGTPAPEKKTVKKRKSWGQQLPEPKTNLPPRKRAKTEDEKEQRRVERVLRNRRAAQSSRERKRQEVEALEAEKHAIERRNQDLEMRLADMEAKNIMLQRELEQFTGNMTVFRGNTEASSPAHTEQFQQAPSPVTFSRDLFGSQDQEKRPSISQHSIVDSQTPQTVNPASLSPEMRPVVESNAMSVGRTTALGAFDFSNLPNLSDNDLHQYYFDAPQPTESDRALFENGILPIADHFDLNFDPLVGDDNSFTEQFNLDEFLHHDEHNQPAPDVQSSDSLAESSAGQQPPIGASFNGCDYGGNAVTV